ncbi:MAG: type III pantothenate kinase [Turicibacter sp.]|nr:type III pantothenate kinase [Turicibacter sp.]MDO5793737.1 type III pantothenate kinase [Turicibacter sp.]
MLVVIDVGNTNITLGVYDRDELIANFRLTTKLQRTSDEFGIALFSFFQTKNINPQAVEDVLISSVVPKIMHSLTNAIRKYFNIEPMIVGPGIKTGISIKTENPREVGADRIVDIAAAYHIYGGPALVIDFGTATTYDYVNEFGEFEFGVTSPGIEISAQALWTQAAKLPEIEIKKPATIMCRNTITSMQGGLVYGYIGQTEYIIQKVKEAVGKEIKVVATGGLGRIIYNETDMIDVYDPDLAFKGMKVIYQKNRS